MKLIVFSVLILYISIHGSDASICQPLSTFRVDCNTCMCEASGQEFTCTKKICPPLTYSDKFIEEKNDAGYTILKPKNEINREVDIDDNDNLVLKKRAPIPYINDIIEPENEIKNDISNDISEGLKETNFVNVKEDDEDDNDEFDKNDNEISNRMAEDLEETKIADDDDEDDSEETDIDDNEVNFGDEDDDSNESD